MASRMLGQYTNLRICVRLPSYHSMSQTFSSDQQQAATLSRSGVGPDDRGGCQESGHI